MSSLFLSVAGTVNRMLYGFYKWVDNNSILVFVTKVFFRAPIITQVTNSVKDVNTVVFNILEKQIRIPE